MRSISKRMMTHIQPFLLNSLWTNYRYIRDLTVRYDRYVCTWWIHRKAGISE